MEQVMDGTGNGNMILIAATWFVWDLQKNKTQTLSSTPPKVQKTSAPVQPLSTQVLQVSQPPVANVSDAAKSESNVTTSAPEKTVSLTTATHKKSHTATESRAGSAFIFVNVTPSGKVWIDGKARGDAPYSGRLSPGSHTIAGGDAVPVKKQLVILKPGERKTITLHIN